MRSAVLNVLLIKFVIHLTDGTQSKETLDHESSYIENPHNGVINTGGLPPEIAIPSGEFHESIDEHTNTECSQTTNSIHSTDEPTTTTTNKFKNNDNKKIGDKSKQDENKISPDKGSEDKLQSYLLEIQGTHSEIEEINGKHVKNQNKTKNPKNQVYNSKEKGDETIKNPESDTSLTKEKKKIQSNTSSQITKLENTPEEIIVAGKLPNNGNQPKLIDVEGEPSYRTSINDSNKDKNITEENKLKNELTIVGDNSYTKKIGPSKSESKHTILHAPNETHDKILPESKINEKQQNPSNTHQIYNADKTHSEDSAALDGKSITPGNPKLYGVKQPFSEYPRIRNSQNYGANQTPPESPGTLGQKHNTAEITHIYGVKQPLSENSNAHGNQQNPLHNSQSYVNHPLPESPGTFDEKRNNSGNNQLYVVKQPLSENPNAPENQQNILHNTQSYGASQIHPESSGTLEEKRITSKNDQLYQFKQPLSENQKETLQNPQSYGANHLHPESPDTLGEKHNIPRNDLLYEVKPPLPENPNALENQQNNLIMPQSHGANQPHPESPGTFGGKRNNPGNIQLYGVKQARSENPNAPENQQKHLYNPQSFGASQINPDSPDTLGDKRNPSRNDQLYTFEQPLSENPNPPENQQDTRNLQSYGPNQPHPESPGTLGDKRKNPGNNQLYGVKQLPSENPNTPENHQNSLHNPQSYEANQPHPESPYTLGDKRNNSGNTQLYEVKQLPPENPNEPKNKQNTLHNPQFYGSNQPHPESLGTFGEKSNNPGNIQLYGVKQAQSENLNAPENQQNNLYNPQSYGASQIHPDSPDTLGEKRSPSRNDQLYTFKQPLSENPNPPKNQQDTRNLQSYGANQPHPERPGTLGEKRNNPKNDQLYGVKQPLSENLNAHNNPRNDQLYEVKQPLPENLNALENQQNNLINPQSCGANRHHIETPSTLGEKRGNNPGNNQLYGVKQPHSENPNAPENQQHNLKINNTLSETPDMLGEKPPRNDQLNGVQKLLLESPGTLGDKRNNPGNTQLYGVKQLPSENPNAPENHRNTVHNPQSYGANQPHPESPGTFGGKRNSPINNQLYGVQQPLSENPDTLADKPNTESQGAFGEKRIPPKNEELYGVKQALSESAATLGEKRNNANITLLFSVKQPPSENPSVPGNQQNILHNPQFYGANQPQPENPGPFGEKRNKLGNTQLYGVRQPHSENPNAPENQQNILHNPQSYGVNQPHPDSPGTLGEKPKPESLGTLGEKRIPESLETFGEKLNNPGDTQLYGVKQPASENPNADEHKKNTLHILQSYRANQPHTERAATLGDKPNPESPGTLGEKRKNPGNSQLYDVKQQISENPVEVENQQNPLYNSQSYGANQTQPEIPGTLGEKPSKESLGNFGEKRIPLKNGQLYGHKQPLSENQRHPENLQDPSRNPNSYEAIQPQPESIGTLGEKSNTESLGTFGEKRIIPPRYYQLYGVKQPPSEGPGSFEEKRNNPGNTLSYGVKHPPSGNANVPENQQNTLHIPQSYGANQPHPESEGTLGDKPNPESLGTLGEKRKNPGNSQLYDVKQQISGNPIERENHQNPLHSPQYYGANQPQPESLGTLGEKHSPPKNQLYEVKQPLSENTSALESKQNPLHSSKTIRANPHLPGSPVTFGDNGNTAENSQLYEIKQPVSENRRVHENEQSSLCNSQGNAQTIESISPGSVDPDTSGEKQNTLGIKKYNGAKQPLSVGPEISILNQNLSKSPSKGKDPSVTHPPKEAGVNQNASEIPEPVTKNLEIETTSPYENEIPPGPKVVPVGSTLEPNVMKKLCRFPKLPAGENICYQRNEKNVESNSLDTWIKICDTIATRLGYFQGMCLYIESPIDSEIYYRVCGISKSNTSDTSNTNSWVYLTTQDIPIKLPPGQECTNNQYKVLHEIQSAPRI